MGGACMTDTRPRHEDETFYVNKQVGVGLWFRLRVATQSFREKSKTVCYRSDSDVKLEEIEVAKRRNPVSGVPLSDQKNSVTVIIYWLTWLSFIYIYFSFSVKIARSGSAGHPCPACRYRIPLSIVY